MADWRAIVRARLAELRLTPSAESELAEEVAQHLEDLYRDLQSGGATCEDAYRETLSELDDIFALRIGIDRNQLMAKHESEPIGDGTSRTLLGDLQRDLRYAGRTLRTNPLFVLVVKVTLGLGIGANTTVFTVVRCVYVPLDQNRLPSMALYVRSIGDPGQTVNAVRGEIQTVGPQVMLSGVRTGEQVVDGSLFRARVGVTLLSVFVLLALGLASIGLYGILAYAVNQRQREIGLRMALGASRRSVLRMVVRQGMSLVVIGMAIGVAAALLVGRLLSGMLFGVGASDPVSLIGATVLLGAIALAACYLPARWATRVDPLVALRQA